MIIFHHNLFKAHQLVHKKLGKFSISKPGKLRIEYKKDNKLLIVADGKWLHYFDTDLNEIQSIIIQKSPAWILLKKNINLKNDFNIKKLEKKKRKNHTYSSRQKL